MNKYLILTTIICLTVFVDSVAWRKEWHRGCIMGQIDSKQPTSFKKLSYIMIFDRFRSSDFVSNLKKESTADCISDDERFLMFLPRPHWSEQKSLIFGEKKKECKQRMHKKGCPLQTSECP